jgi:hypothetical protein
MPEQNNDLRWAAEVVPQLREQARAEALEVARARLRDQLVELLLGTPAPRHADQRLGLWLYGVMDGDAAGPPQRRGVDSAHDVELIRHAGLAALVSAVPLDEYDESGLRETLEDLDKLEVLARAHEVVLDDALGIGAVVPFRICTVYASAARVEEMLERERRPLTAALGRLRGMSEWGVKAYAVAGPNDVPAGEPVSGVDYLSRKRAARAAAEGAREAVDTAVENVHARLRERAAGAVLSAPQDKRLTGREAEMVLNGAYLVGDADADDFGALVAELAARHLADGMQLELTGPWPAYHFSEVAAG